MRIDWIFTDIDIRKIKEFCNNNDSNSFVNQRISRNVLKKNLDLTRDSFWERSISVLLTSQQRSGPKSSITRFIHTEPFPLNLEVCSNETNLKEYAIGILGTFGGIRRYIRIAEEITYNLNWINNDDWELVQRIYHNLSKNDNYQDERCYAQELAKSLKGIGPKQSRNLLQSLGLTKYEIPLDSRIIKWFNDFGFPYKLTSISLSDEYYYQFVMDSIRILCEKIEMYPCVLDAIIFSSYDDDWSQDNVIW